MAHKIDTSIKGSGVFLEDATIVSKKVGGDEYYAKLEKHMAEYKEWLANGSKGYAPVLGNTYKQEFDTHLIPAGTKVDFQFIEKEMVNFTFIESSNSALVGNTIVCDDGDFHSFFTDNGVVLGREAGFRFAKPYKMESESPNQYFYNAKVVGSAKNLEKHLLGVANKQWQERLVEIKENIAEYVEELFNAQKSGDEFKMVELLEEGPECYKPIYIEFEQEDVKVEYFLRTDADFTVGRTIRNIKGELSVEHEVTAADDFSTEIFDFSEMEIELSED